MTANYEKFVKESSDEAYDEYAAEMRASGQEPVSKEEWDAGDAEDVPSYEDYIKALGGANSKRTSDKIDPIFRDEWEDFDDSEKIETVAALRQSELAGDDKIERDDYGNRIVPPTEDDEETVKVRVGKD